ncbi:MAG TPA: translesion DNA synthesis-associated protein ImuA [Burkholderiaceae bacterium]|jgi:protein ImuA|nr:translesion DNA synthesis-associated protein ImuA [Burkholderiaceae bacterium]
MSSIPAPLPLEHLHPALWRAHQVGREQEVGIPTGYAALDAELPGGGWPRRALVELLLGRPGWGEVRLLAPALAPLSRAGRGLLFMAPPVEPSAEAWTQLGFDLTRCVLVRGPDVLWPLEQALRSGAAGAVVAWLPAGVRSDALRRLQLAAQSHDGPAFLFREPAAARQASPAPLRIALEGAGPDVLALQVLKRRGPQQLEPLSLELPPVLSPMARERALNPRRAVVPGLPFASHRPELPFAGARSRAR